MGGDMNGESPVGGHHQHQIDDMDDGGMAVGDAHHQQ